MNNIPTSAKETLNKQLTRRLRELKFWEYDEAQDLKIIAESHELTDLVNEINEKFYFDETKDTTQTQTLRIENNTSRQKNNS